jgi:[FeFe] hydrogenase H-cluster maturation GTPase HydF
MISDCIQENDLIVLVIPIDESAPKGRLILPQQMVMRDILDSGAQVLVVKDTELENALNTIGKKPKLVVTDSQVFGKVKKIVPKDVLLTSFSIVMARFKGFLDSAVKGAKVLDQLKDGDKVLISEGCSHHRQCGDIGTVKLPKWILEYTGKNIEFVFTQGGDFPENLSDFSLIVHCGGCMLTEREVARRRKSAEYHGVPFTNYGTTIAQINGILDVSLEFLK